MKNVFLKTSLLIVCYLWTIAQPAQAGWIKRYIYSDITGTAVTNLLNGTNSAGVVVFPDSPSEIQWIPQSVTGPYWAESASAIGDNFGSYLPGYLEPPETGNYIFWVCGDDETQLWLTSDAADPLNPDKKQMIARVPGWSNARDWTKYPEQQSAAVYLEKGKQYYLEVLHKEGTGGDNVGWGWQLPSGILERPQRTFYLQPKADTDPTKVSGPNLAAISPMSEFDYTIYDGMEVMLFADLNLTPPYTVQWLRGGSDISGATQTYYRFRARTSDNGAQFSIRVNGTVYGPITLTVIADTTKPELVSATLGANNPTQVQLVFSEIVTADSATNTANYTLNSGTVQNAQLLDDGRTVLLKTTLLPVGQNNTLNISGIQDMALPPNTIALTQTNFLVTDGAITFRIWYSSSVLSAQSLAGVRTWSGVSSTAASYTNQLFNEERTITTTSYQWNLIPLRNNWVGQMIGYVTAPETGDYKFGIASDDHSVLYLGTSELPESKREICYRDGSTGRWNLGVAAASRSAYIYLEAGKRYYLEAVHRDGTGGDGVTVAWEKPSDTAAGRLLPSANESVQANTEPFLISPIYLSTYRTFGNVFFKTNLPASFSAAESTQPELVVVADGSTPYGYQWYKNDAPIAGATGASYTLPFVRPADNNAAFYVVVNNNFSSVTSAVATLTVTVDTVKPAVVSVGSLYKQTVEVRLSEPVVSAMATDTGNYQLLSSAGTPVTINAVVVDAADPAHLTLQTAALPETDLMQLVVQNLADLSTAANVMDPQTNLFRANNFDALTRINNSQAYSASAVGDQIFMTAGGSDIWGAADQCVFLRKTVTGNFDYKVRGISLPAVNGWCKMGPMARDGTANGARNAFVCFTPVTPGQNQYSAQLRDTTGGASTASATATDPLGINLQPGAQPNATTRPTISYPSWLRLQRVGNGIYYYYSSNGTNWTFWTWYDSAASSAGPLPATLEFGLALTSHDTARTVDSVMSSFSAIDDGALRFTLTPTNATVAEGGTAVFAAAVAGHSPWFFEWSKNGVPIYGATSNTLTITAIPFTDNNSTFTCRVTNPYGESVSSTVKLTVLEPDTTKPTAVSVGSLFKTIVEVRFSEPVTTDSAITVGNYTLLTSAGATVGISYIAHDPEDPAHVTLYTANMPETDLVRLICSGIVDRSVAANVMDRQTNIFRANNFDAFDRINNSQNYSARAEGDQIFLTSGGSDIWGTSDQFAFLYKSVTGDFDYKVQGVSLPLVNSWSKMGPMARVSTGPGERNVFCCFTPITGQGTYSAQVRTNLGVATSSTAAGEPLLLNLQSGVTARPTITYPSWLRLKRVGNNIYYFFSRDGVSWTFWTWYDSSTSSEGPLPESLVFGLAITSHDAAQTVEGVMSSFSVVQEGPLGFALEPVNTTADEGGSAVFTALATGRSPFTYQWMKNGVDIAGAVAATLNLANVPLLDDGATYSCRIANPFGDSATSSNAVLTVIQDTTKPIAYAVGSLHGTGIGVYFSDLNRIDPITASDPANYVVNGGAVTVTNATVEPDNLAVMLSLSAPISGQFSVEVKNVTDAAPTLPNTIDTVTVYSTVVTWPLYQDIGTLSATPPLMSDPVMPGFTQAIGTNGFYVHAGGSDIWNVADGMHFVYQALTGSFDIAVRVAGLRQADVWSKAGLMIREDLDAGSRNYMSLVAPTTGQNLINMQWRLTKDAASASMADAVRPRPSPIPNAWLRVTRTNENFAFYWGTNGTDWVTLFTTNETTAPYPDKVYVGMATTSHNNGATLANTTGAYYRDVTGLQPLEPVTPPTLTITRSGADAVLSWIYSGATLTLQSTGSLLPINWQAVTTTPVVNGNTNTVTVPISGAQQYFRLMQP